MARFGLYMNFKPRSGPFGGANSFLRSLRRSLVKRGTKVTDDVTGKFDVALVNALTNDVTCGFLEKISSRGVPVVHRKVGYQASGGPELRREVDGVVWGDKLQIEFGPWVDHTIFQSTYSRDSYYRAGFSGECSVIRNGVDESVFNPYRWRTLRWQGRRREYWDGASPLRVLISSWSTDMNKGFPEFEKIDRAIEGERSVKVSFVGRLPEGLQFENIRVHGPKRHPVLAKILRNNHVLLQLARHETCSNSLIEGINCGLPVIYLDSGSNQEIAGDYGVEYQGDFRSSVDQMGRSYHRIVQSIHDNPYKMEEVASKYLCLLEKELNRD
jgi:glycosyltransferase involved in cell wall biosynthesis